MTDRPAADGPVQLHNRARRTACCRPANGDSDMHGAPSRADREAAGRLLLCTLASPGQQDAWSRSAAAVAKGTALSNQPPGRPAGGPAAAARDHECAFCGRGAGEGRSPSRVSRLRGVGFTCTRTSTAGCACLRAAPAPLAAVPGQALSVLLAPMSARCAVAVPVRAAARARGYRGGGALDLRARARSRPGAHSGARHQPF